MSASQDLCNIQSRWQLPVEGFFLADPAGVPRLVFMTEEGEAFENNAEKRFALLAQLEGIAYCCSQNPRDVRLCLSHLASLAPKRNYLELVCITQGNEIQTLKTCQDPAPAINRAGPLLFLMDFGKVVCDFDYAWFADSFHAAFGKAPTPEALSKAEELRPQFEAGKWSTQEFFQQVRTLFQLENSDYLKFSQAWCGFLNVNPIMVKWLRQFLQRPQTQVRVVSNVDPWVVEHARTALGLRDLFEDGVFSYLAEVNPKDIDASMWKLAKKRGLQKLDASQAFTIATDDTAPHLERVQLENAADLRICFQNPEQWLFELGRHGIRLPLS